MFSAVNSKFLLLFPLLVLLLSMLLMQGCAHSQYDQGGRLYFYPDDVRFERLENAKVCCNHISQLEFKKLEFNQTYEFSIDSSLPVYRLATGKSYVLALELPFYYRDYQVRVESFFAKELFYPNVAILNSKYFVVKTVNQKKIRRGAVRKFSSAFLSGTFDVNEMDEDARYMIIYTTSALLKSKLIIGAGQPDGYDVHPGPEGEIEVRLIKPRGNKNETRQGLIDITSD